MRVESWDAEFVRARRRDVHPFVRAVAEYGLWWPGVSTRPAGEHVLLTLRPPGRLRRSHRVAAAVRRERPGLGVELAYAGDLDGEAEWFYLDERAGVVVNYIVRADVGDRGWRRALEHHRSVVRAGLHALKDRLEAGRAPGTEPDAGLLADQRTALAGSGRPPPAGRLPQAGQRPADPEAAGRRKAGP